MMEAKLEVMSKRCLDLRAAMWSRTRKKMGNEEMV